jgi:hypothetical protein
MNRFVFVLLPLLFIFLQKLSGQIDGSSHHLFSGKVIDDSLNYALPSVHVWNESTRKGTISNDSGEFKIGLRNQDTIVFTALGYESSVIVVSGSLNQLVRLKPKAYEIDEVVVKRFRSYQSFIYQVVHHELPETKTAELREYLHMMSISAALEADRERAVEDKLKSGRFGYITPLGPGIDREKIFREKISALEERKRVIETKFNRELVGVITQLEGDELTEFISMCNFSEEYLYETDLYTIVDALYEKFHEYQNMRDSIPSFNEN